jgi:hypothetical protein
MGVNRWISSHGAPLIVEKQGFEGLTGSLESTGFMLHAGAEPQTRAPL